MKSLKQILRRIYTPFLVAALIVSSVFALKFHEKKEKALDMAATAKEETGKIQLKFDSVAQKSLADELFINGQYDSAMMAYEMIPNGGGKSEFLKNREGNRAKISDFYEGLKDMAEKRINMQQSILQMEMIAARSDFEKAKDSSETTLTERIQSLESRLSKKEQEMADSPDVERIVFYNANGTKVNYFGEVKNGRANGQGIGSHATGSVYDGEWQDNQKHGKGTYTWDQGEVYEGDFVKDKREGEGTYLWPNGNKYVGRWENDQRSGSGKLFDKENKIIVQGEWENDKIVELAN